MQVLNWKLEIQKYDIQFEYIKGSQNVAADIFSRLVNRPKGVVNTTILTSMPPHIKNLIANALISSGAHWGERKTYELLSKYYPLTVNEQETLQLRNYNKIFIKECPTCQKMSTINMAIKATRFTLASYAPLMKISMDTIGPLPVDNNNI